MRETFLPFHRPHIDDDDVAAVVDSLANGWLTSGPRVQDFEREFAQACGARHAIALSSCTAALELGLVALGIGPGDEVVMPSLTFVAGAQCARHLGATPVFADIEEDTLSVSARTIERVVTKRTKLIMPMHYAGRPAGIADIMALAQSKGIAVLEDAAHCTGMIEGGLWAGARSDAAAYSFYATKNIASAEGGMLVTNRDDVAERVRVIALHGMSRDAWARYTAKGSWRYDVIDTGYKCNLPDVLAALGVAQLRKLERMQSRREEIVERYADGLDGARGVRIGGMELGPGDRHAWCMCPVLVDERGAGISRDAFIDALRARNIGTSVHYIPTHRFTAYKDQTAKLPVTDRVADRLVSLPIYPSMTDADVDDVIEAVADVVPRRSRAGAA